MELFDIPLEQAVLGACIKNNTLIDRASSVLSPENFYDPLHQRIFSTMERMHGAGEQVLPTTLRAALKGDVGLEEVGYEYIQTLSDASPALPNIISISRAVKEYSTKRSILSVAENISSQINEHTAKEAIEHAERALYALAERSHFGSRMLCFGDAIHRAMQQAEDAQNSGGKITGVPTGFTEIDQMLGGLQRSDLIIIAGRPGMGKTALATNMAFYAASVGRPVLFFSLEMSAEQLTNRIMAEQSGVETWRIRNGQMRPAEWDDYVSTGGKFREVPLFIDDTGGVSLPQLASRARRAKRENNISAIIVDYIQLMNSGKKNENRVQEVTEITKGLKSLAKELDVPILALSQLSRGVDARDDKRPVLSDLRESGSIEQDSDCVMFVYRPEYYLKSREPDISDPHYGKWQEQMEKVHGKAEIILEKHRHGATGTIRLNFDGRFTKFSDPSS